MPFSDWIAGRTGQLTLADVMQWRTDLLLLHGLSDAVIAISFMTIAIGMIWYMRQRYGLLREHRFVAWLFCSLIVAAALSHLLEMLAVWYPIHGLHGAAKGIT